MFRSLDISMSSVKAARLRMEATSSNLANANSSAPDDASLYRVLRVDQNEAGAYQGLPGLGKPNGVEYRLAPQEKPPRLEFDPDHPDADANGMVRYPDVDVVAEMTELMAARRAYEAGLTAYSEGKQLFFKTLEIGRS